MGGQPMSIGYTNLSKTERESGTHIRDANGLKPKRRTGPSVGERLQAAYEKVMAKRPKVDASEAQPAIA
jgi:hypothetical protein